MEKKQGTIHGGNSCNGVDKAINANKKKFKNFELP
jgi:hypothetical protein